MNTGLPIGAATAAEIAFFNNFEGSSTQKAQYAAKLQALTRSPRRLDDFLIIFHDFLAKARANNPVTDSCQPLPPKLTATFKKASLIRTARFFQNAGCRNLKICFGLDACLLPQLIVSGAFVRKNGQFDQLDSFYTVGQPPQTYYKLNFGRRISQSATRELLRRFQTIASQGLHGYLLDIDTFLLFLTDPAYLGKAKNITVRFGMNNDGSDLLEIPDSELVQIMMIEFRDAVQPSATTPFYMCNSAVKNDSDPDPTACPPRQPCNGSA